MDTRTIYNNCFRAWRRGETLQKQDLWRDHLAIYRAAGDSYVNNLDYSSGWVNEERWLKWLSLKVERRTRGLIPCSSH